MNIIERIDQDLKEALKAGDRAKATVLRGLKSDLKYKQIDARAELTEAMVIDTLSSAAKKRRESIEQYGQGGRQDLVDKETSELEIIEVYLPQQLTEVELRKLVSEAVEEAGAESPRDMGKVMKVLMPKVKGRADGKLVNRLVSEILAK